jgi:Zn-dependent protease with chaperone function
MPFLLMVFLTVVCLPEVTEWPRPVWTDSPAWCFATTGLGVLLVCLNAWRISRALVRGLGGDPARREYVLRRYERGRVRHHLLMLAVYLLSLIGLGWGWAVGQDWSRQGEPVWIAAEGREEVPLMPLAGAEVLVLAPFILAQLLSWALFADADHACNQPARSPEPLTPVQFGSRVSYVLFQARQKLALVFLPVVLLIAHKELHRLLPDDTRDWETAISIAGPVAVAAVFVTLPWTVRLLLGLRPLPEGPLRARLQAASRRLRFRCSNLLVWNTRSGMGNAMVIGLLPWIRYVVFTDRLLEEFSPEEVEAVFGHEVGHVKHQHMLYYLGFLLGSVFILGSVAQMAVNYVSPNGKSQDWLAVLAKDLHLGEHGYLAFVPLVVLLLSYIFVVFGFLSRRCERQADVFGCRAVSCTRADCAGHGADAELADRGGNLCPTGIRTFIGALEKVAQVNGISRDRPGFLQSWQHSTIARRVEFLQRVLADPAVEARFQRRVAVVKWALLAVLGVTLAVLLNLGKGLSAPVP